VPVRAADAVGVRRTEQFAREEVGAQGLARSGRTDGEHGHQVGGLDDAGPDAGREAEAHGGDVAAGHRDAVHAGEVLTLLGA
jgi:hypothetical protein